MAIYFIRNERTGNIKIGFSVDPDGRLQQLRTSHCDELRMLLSIPGEMSDERGLHRKFARFRVRGEWFRPEPEIMSEMDRLRNHFYPPKREYPFSGLQTFRSVYLAGKISKYCWRHSFFPKPWSLRNWDSTPLFDYDDFCNNFLGEYDDDCFQWRPMQDAILIGDRWKISYVGPFFSGDDHGCGHKFDHGWTGLGGTGAECCYRSNGMGEIRDLCLQAIRDADLIFAWIDTQDCFGTIAELGYARALHKKIFVAGPEMFREMWFAYSLADCLYFHPTKTPKNIFDHMINSGNEIGGFGELHQSWAMDCFEDGEPDCEDYDCDDEDPDDEDPDSVYYGHSLDCEAEDFVMASCVVPANVTFDFESNNNE